jgi:ligand-binding sensor domain-containing protein
VVIATVFLTIIGMAGGYVLGERHRRDTRASGQQPSGPTPATVTTPSPERPSGPACPPETIAQARKLQLPTDLTQVFKIVTDNGSTVWICEDPQGALYYQGKTGGVDAKLVQAQNGLFLDRVQKIGDDQYEADVPNNGNQIEVDRQRLQIRFADGKVQTNAVVSVE